LFISGNAFTTFIMSKLTEMIHREPFQHAPAGRAGEPGVHADIFAWNRFCTRRKILTTDGRGCI